jgi:DHA2 family methylenomycin A resistance protein-like MFS transporter
MLDWRLVFAINLPVCAGMLLLLRHVTPSPRRPAPLDWPGQVLAVITLAVLTYGLIRGGSVGFREPSVILALTGAGVGLAAFTIVQARSRHPMMRLDLFRSRGMRIALAAGFAFIAGWFGTVFLVSLFLQQHLGLSPLHAGLVFFPAALASMTGNLLSGAIRNRYGPRVPVVGGLLSMVIGLLALLATTPLGSPLLTAGLLLLIGPGGSVAMPAATGLVLDSTVAERAGIASGAFNTFRQIGGAVAIAVFGGVLTNASTFVSGMQISLAIAASLLLLTALLALRIPPYLRSA